MARLTLFLILLLALTSYGQSSENPCVLKAKNAMAEIPELYSLRENDKVDSILNDWEYKCGRTEMSNRLRTLLQIKKGTFQEYDFDFSDYNRALEYLQDERFVLLMDSVHENPREIYRTYFSEPDLFFAYNKFTKDLAKQIAEEKRIDLDASSCDTEVMLLQLYSNHFKPFIQSIKTSDCKSILAVNYKSQVQNVRNRSKLDIAFLGSLWMPYGNNSVLGNHGGFGFLIGWGYKRMIFDFDFDIRTGKAKKTYNVFYNDAVTPTNDYFGVYFGFDAGYELAKIGKSKFYLLGGIGADGFDCIEGDTKKDIESKSIFSLNVNSGLGWRIYSRDGAYVGLEVKHNFINYKNPQGTPLDGNAMGVRLLIGLLKNESQTRQLAQLKNIFD